MKESYEDKADRKYQEWKDGEPMNEKQLNEERVQSGRTMNDQHKRIGQLERELAEAQAQVATAEAAEKEALAERQAYAHKFTEAQARLTEALGCLGYSVPGTFLPKSLDPLLKELAELRAELALTIDLDKQRLIEGVRKLSAQNTERGQQLTEAQAQVAALTDALLTQLDNTAAVAAEHDAAVRKKALLDAATLLSLNANAECRDECVRCSQTRFLCKELRRLAEEKP